MRGLIVFIVLILSFEVFGRKGKVMSLKLSSSAFKHIDFIPAKYTCDG